MVVQLRLCRTPEDMISRDAAHVLLCVQKYTNRQYGHVASQNRLVFPRWKRGGLVVERRTPEREVGGSILTQVAVL